MCYHGEKNEKGTKLIFGAFPCHYTSFMHKMRFLALNSQILMLQSEIVCFLVYEQSSKILSNYAKKSSYFLTFKKFGILMFFIKA